MSRLIVSNGFVKISTAVIIWIIPYENFKRLSQTIAAPPVCVLWSWRCGSSGRTHKPSSTNWRGWNKKTCTLYSNLYIASFTTFSASARWRWWSFRQAKGTVTEQTRHRYPSRGKYSLPVVACSFTNAIWQMRKLSYFNIIIYCCTRLPSGDNWIMD